MENTYQQNTYKRKHALTKVWYIEKNIVFRYYDVLEFTANSVIRIIPHNSPRNIIASNNAIFMRRLSPCKSQLTVWEWTQFNITWWTRYYKQQTRNQRWLIKVKLKMVN